MQVNKATYTNATELYKQLLEKNVRLYSGIRDGNRLLGRALIMKAPDAVINIMLDQKPDEVSIQTKFPLPHSTRSLILPLEIAIRQNYSLDIVRKIFWLTDDKIDPEWFMAQNYNCLVAAISHLYCNGRSWDGIEKSRQTVLFLLNILPELISDSTTPYAYRILKTALFNGMESEVMCKLLKLNDKLLDEIDTNGDTILLLILRKSDVDNYINVLNMMATISKKKGINCIAHTNLKGDDALDIARNTNCSGAVINSLCGFYNFSNAFETTRTIKIMDQGFNLLTCFLTVGDGSRITSLQVNFAMYAIIGKMNEPAVLRILSEFMKVRSPRVENLMISTNLTEKKLNYTLLSMAINAKYGFDVITEICDQFRYDCTVSYKKEFPALNYIRDSFLFHDLLYERLEYTLLQRDIRRHDIPDVESYRRLYADRIVQPFLDKTEWHTMFYRLLGERSCEPFLRHEIATTAMFWIDKPVYPLEFVVRLGLALTYVKTLYEAYPEAIEDNNYSVIFHSLRCRNNDTLYEDVILFLLEKLNGTSKFDSNEAPWYHKTPLLIAEQQFWVDSGQQSTIWPRSRHVINAINKKFPHI
jgi:hypothetical protein